MFYLPLFLFGAVGVLLGIASVLMSLLGSKSRFANLLFNSSHLRSGKEVREDVRRELAAAEKTVSPNEKYLHTEGVTKTTLRPVGKVQLDSGEILDMVTQGELLAAAVRVRVVEVHLNRIVVAQIFAQAEKTESAK